MKREMGARQFGGAAMVLLAITIIVQVALHMAAAKLNVDRTDIGKTLADIEDHKGLFLASIGVEIFGNMVAVLVGVALFAVLAGRSSFRRTIGLVAFAAGSILFDVSDIAQLVMGRIAADGAAGANPDLVLELGRVFGFVALYLEGTAFGFIGLAVLAISWIFVEGARQEDGPQPAFPAWLGWLGIIVGLFMQLIWLAAANQSLFLVAVPGLLGSLVWLVATGLILWKAPPEPAAS